MDTRKITDTRWIQGDPERAREILRYLQDDLHGRLPEYFRDGDIEVLFGDPEYIFWVNRYGQIKGTKDPGIIEIVKQRNE